MRGRFTQHYTTVLVLVGILALSAFITYERLSPGGMFAELQNDLKAIEPPPDAAYTDLEGNPLSLERFKGKPLIINSWATWMPFSAQELSLLERIKSEYGDRIDILAINRMEDRPVLHAYRAQYGLSGNVIMVSDPTDNFYVAVGGYAMPETVFYRSDGTILFHKRGVLTEDELRSAIDALLE